MLARGDIVTARSWISPISWKSMPHAIDESSQLRYNPLSYLAELAWQRGHARTTSSDVLKLPLLATERSVMEHDTRYEHGPA